MYKAIKKYLGTGWLERELEKAKRESGLPEYIIYAVFLEINRLIERLQNTVGFLAWAKEARTSKDSDAFLFELTCFENLMVPSNVIHLKENDGAVEGLVKSRGEEFFIEMHNMKQLSGSARNKVNKLFAKGRRKFTNKKGVLFVGCNPFHDGTDLQLEVLLKIPDIRTLVAEIARRLETRTNTQIIAIVLVFSNWHIDPRTKNATTDKAFLVLPKPERKGGPNLKFLSGILAVKELYVQDSLLHRHTT